MTEPQLLHLESFTEHLGTKFQADVEDSKAVELEMVSAEDAGTNLAAGQEQFTIVFRGPLDQALEQRTYKIKHPQMGTFDLFLVPIRKAQDGLYYEACFARIV